MNKISSLPCFLSVLAIAGPVLLTALPAKADEPFTFTKIIATNEPSGQTNFAEISAPIFRNGKFYFKTLALGKKNKPLYSIYSYSPDEGLKLILDPSAKVPGTKYPFSTILDFDVKGDAIVFAGEADHSETLGIYLLQGGKITRLVGGPEKMPTRPLFFKEINDVTFLGDGFVYSGGREEREGLYYFKDGESTLLAHQPIEIWAGRDNLEHMTVQSLSRLTRIDGDLVVSFQKKHSGDLYAAFYSFGSGGALQPWHEDIQDTLRSAGVEEVGAVSGTAGHLLLLGFDKYLLGTLYQLDGGALETVASNETPLWTGGQTEVDRLAGKTLKAGDMILPSRELFFRKASTGFPFWRNVYTIYEMDGLYQDEYINGFVVMDEKHPLYENYKTGRWFSTLLKAAIASYVGGAGAASIVVANDNTLFAKHAPRGDLVLYASRAFSWENYFQVPLTAGDGGFATNGETTIFHGANLQGKEGLFLYKNGVVTKVLDNDDSLFGAKVLHIYVGFDAFQGDDFVFWVELSAGIGATRQVLVRARPNGELEPAAALEVNEHSADNGDE